MKRRKNPTNIVTMSSEHLCESLASTLEGLKEMSAEDERGHVPMSKRSPFLKTEAFEMHASHEQPGGRDLSLYRGSGNERLYTAEEWQWMELALKILEKTMPRTVKQGHRGLDRQTVKNVREEIRKRRNAYEKYMRESVR